MHVEHNLQNHFLSPKKRNTSLQYRKTERPKTFLKKAEHSAIM